MRILIADDEVLHNLALKSNLEALGHDVVATAKNGREAVLMARELKPDLVFLDIRMPVLTGTEAAHQIAADRSIPIIMLSAYSDRKTVEQAARAPIFHYLVKPVDAEDLSPAIAVARARFLEWNRARERRENLHTTLEDRKVVERAKGLLMETRHLSEKEAMSFLAKTSEERGTTLTDMARKIVLAASLIQNE